jgi:hypothetical protein
MSRERRVVPGFTVGARGLRPWLIQALLWLFIAGIAQACSIPVFRYALDRWPADPYRLEVSTGDSKDDEVARFLRNFTDSTPINLQPIRLSEDGPSRLQFSHEEASTNPVWQGPLAGELPRLLDSPVRSEIVKRILAGENGVWLLVESADSAANETAAKALEKRLRYLEQVAQLPKIDPDDPSSRLGPGPALQVKFSLVRVRRDDPAETHFVRMLAGPKNDREVSSGPWLALVFGRGRVLGAWPAEGFGDEQIDETCLFLLGACSCQVKRMNPGWDLLLHVDWDERLRALGMPTAAVEEKSVAPLPVETVTVQPGDASADVQPAAEVAPAQPSGASLSAVGAILVIGAGAIWFARRK